MLVLIVGVSLGTAIGAASRWAQFCTLGAIADSVVVGDQRRLRAWVLAMAIAIAGTQILHMTGIVDIGRSIYLAGGFGWLGALIGGGLFGLGMALVGTCGYGTLLRLGGGDLRALADMVTIGIAAYATLSGPLAYVRTSVIEPTAITLPAQTAPGIPDVIAFSLGVSDELARPAIVLVLVLSLLYFCLADQRFRASLKEISAAVVMGLAIVSAWAVTGNLGHDAFDPKPPVSLTFVRPLGDSMLYAMLASGMTLNFGITSVAGVLLGAHLVARAKGQLRREGFDGDREMARHLIGSALMGVGGVLALGCTIGQGMSGLSTLALTAPLAFFAIFVGAALGLRYLEEGSLISAIRVLAGRPHP